MKRLPLFLILAAALLITVVANAVPALLKHEFFTRQVPDRSPVYTLHYIQTPNWWPH